MLAGYAHDILYAGLRDEVSMDAGPRSRTPQSPHAIAAIGVTWAEITKMLGDQIIAANPELRNRQWMMKLHLRSNGVRVEFFEEEGFRRAETEAAIIRMSR